MPTSCSPSSSCRPEFSGAPTLVHGGATLALMDEAMAWATIAIGGKFAFTKETIGPVRLAGAPRTAVPRRGTDHERRRAPLRDRGAVVLDAKGRACVQATAGMSILDLDQASDAIGTTPTGDDAGYVR